MDDAPIIFKEDINTCPDKILDKFWKVMIIDDEKSIHDITMTSLKQTLFEGRRLQFLNAYSSAEAMELLDQHPDTALLLVDVVMETENAGLNLVHYVREKLKNKMVQVVIRTGQPGMAPEHKITSNYKINAYYSKTELRIQKLISIITTSLRTYKLSLQLNSELKKRKQAELDLKELNRDLEKKIEIRTEEIARANQLKSQFLANMSHEIRTPMNGIIGMANILKDENLTKDQNEYVDIIRNSADSLLTIINDILDLSKIESGQLAFEQRSFSIKMLINEVRSIFQFKADEKNLKLQTQISKTIPHFLSGDETRIKQILINLVGNAIKFTEKGEVKINVASEKELEGHFIISFRVEDTGPGIEETYMEKLFSKFSQQDATITRKYGGTGLGLAICKHLARLMSGDIKVENKFSDNKNFNSIKKSGGAVFTVFLKIRKNISDVDSRNKEEQSNELLNSLIKKNSKLNLKILLAEDNLVNQRVMSIMLEKMKLSAEIAKDGEQVLRKMKKSHFDLILMDVQMPRLDGIETTKIIRDPNSDIKQKDIPIIALTALAMQEDAKKCLKAGMDQYLTKPIHSEKLIKSIAKIFN